MCRLKGARKPCVGIAQQVAALMAPGKHLLKLLKLLNGGDDRGRGAAKKKGAEIAQRLWRPREAKHKKCRNCATALATPDRAHRRFSTNFPFPARPNQKKRRPYPNLELRRRLWRPGARKKRNVATKGKRNNKCVELAQWMWRLRGANKKETCWKCARGRTR